VKTVSDKVVRHSFS